MSKIAAVTFTSITDIRNHKFIGNHASDMSAFMGISNFMNSDATKKEKVEAGRIAAKKGMGIEYDKSMTDDEIIEDWSL